MLCVEVKAGNYNIVVGRTVLPSRTSLVMGGGGLKGKGKRKRGKKKKGKKRETPRLAVFLFYYE